ncbi:hypothetical protein HDU83_004307 [Entophlyctis luteolus]|nr:hypothetical protein HDU83_004307 [Entophlyctis luteolus]
MSPFDLQLAQQHQFAPGAAFNYSLDFSKILASNGILIDLDQRPAYEFLVETLSLWNNAPAPAPKHCSVSSCSAGDAPTSIAASDEATGPAPVATAGDTPQKSASEIKPASLAAATRPPKPAMGTALLVESAQRDVPDAEPATPEPMRGPRVRQSASAGGGRKRPAKKENTKKKAPQRTCSHCSTSTTSVWRRSPDGKRLCNACGVFAKAHGVLRPLELRKDFVYTRKRKAGPKRKANDYYDDDAADDSDSFDI